MADAWPKGSMTFSISGEVHTSKEDESPSDFIFRVLRTSKELNGDSVLAYMKVSLGD